MKWVALVACALVTTSLDGAEPSWIQRVETDWSPGADILVQYCVLREGGEQIWLASSTDFNKRRLLFSNQRNAKVLFADDKEWLAINDHAASNESSLILFKRFGELDYREQVDLTGQAWDFFCKQNRISQTGFDHSYVEALSWIDEPRAILLELSGHLDSKHHVDNWFCIYDVEAKKFITDFSALNKHQVVFPTEKH